MSFVPSSVLRNLRLALALLALAVALAGPGAALAAGPLAAPMPCHEAVGAGVSVPGAQPDHAAGTTDIAARHLCCVLAQIVLPPLAVPDLAPPLWQIAALPLPGEALLPGRVPAIPVPPPRSA